MRDVAIRKDMVIGTHHRRFAVTRRAIADALMSALERRHEVLDVIVGSNDRRSAVDQWNLSIAEALVHETRLGIDSLRSGEAVEGATRFTGGAGRGGATVAPHGT